jgi:orotate phosphoribosyltransferase
MLPALIKKDCWKFGNFALPNGEGAEDYIDLYNLTLTSEGVFQIAQEIIEKIDFQNVDAIGGPSLGADPVIGAMLAILGKERNVKGFFVRKKNKEYGTTKLIEGPLEKGDRCVLVEDVTSSGASLMKGVLAVQNFGCEVVQTISIVDRLEGATELFASHNLKFTSLLTIDDLA